MKKAEIKIMSELYKLRWRNVGICLIFLMTVAFVLLFCYYTCIEKFKIASMFGVAGGTSVWWSWKKAISYLFTVDK